MLQWFGGSWGAPVCVDSENVPIPIGERCFACGMSFSWYSQGLMVPHVGHKGVTPRPWHLACFLGILRPMEAG